MASTVPENTLFLNTNKFWYSNGSSPIKGFRAYFDLTDVLSTVEASRIVISFVNTESTGISEASRQVDDDKFYNLSGQRVSKASRGIYIVNGKKVVKK